MPTLGGHKHSIGQPHLVIQPFPRHTDNLHKRTRGLGPHSSWLGLLRPHFTIYLLCDLGPSLNSSSLHPLVCPDKTAGEMDHGHVQTWEGLSEAAYTV